MRQKATCASVLLVEFFRDYDAARRGFTSPHIFLRAVDTARCFTDMSKAELRMVLRMFTEPRPQQFKVRLLPCPAGSCCTSSAWAAAHCR
jgi:hypothetical protein